MYIIDKYTGDVDNGLPRDIPVHTCRLSFSLIPSVLVGVQNDRVSQFSHFSTENIFQPDLYITRVRWHLVLMY